MTAHDRRSYSPIATLLLVLSIVGACGSPGEATIPPEDRVKVASIEVDRSTSNLWKPRVVIFLTPPDRSISRPKVTVSPEYEHGWFDSRSYQPRPGNMVQGTIELWPKTGPLREATPYMLQVVDDFSSRSFTFESVSLQGHLLAITKSAPSLSCFDGMSTSADYNFEVPPSGPDARTGIVVLKDKQGGMPDKTITVTRDGLMVEGEFTGKAEGTTYKCTPRLS